MRQSLLSAAVFLCLFSVPFPALADEETDALRQQIKQLEARLNQLERREQERAQASPAGASTPTATLESRVSVLERNDEIAAEAKAQAPKPPTIEVGNGKGITVTSPDKQYSFRFGAYVQGDNRTYLNGGGAPDTFLIRSARPIIEAKATDYFSGRLMLDFGQGTTRLLDAYTDFKPVPDSKLFSLRAGKFKVPLGLERWQAEQELLFVERGLTTNLVPFRDLGVMAFGELVPNRLSYELAVTNGAVDLGDNNIDNNSAKDINGRLFAYPFRQIGVPLLEDLGLGVAGSYGTHGGSAAAPNVVPAYLTTGQSPFFSYRSAAGSVVYANGTEQRLNPQAMYYHGSLGLLGEYVSDGQEVRRGATRRMLTNDAWMGIASYVLTGEDASFNGVRPSAPFDLAQGHWGAFEVVGRYGRLNVDSHAFPYFADITTSAKSATEMEAGINWYLNNAIKLNLDYAWTRFVGGAVSGDRAGEQVVMTRVQYRF